MPESRIDGMRDAIRNRAHKMFTTNNLSLSPTEFIDTFIDPDHINALTEVQEIVGEVGMQWASSEFYTDFGEVKELLSFSINFERRPPIILPKYVSDGPRISAPHDVRTKINQWVVERVRLGKVFGDAVDSLNWLNTNCKDTRAMRAMFPALPTLLRDVAADDKSATARLAIKLDSSKAVTNLPTLPREVRDRILDASNLVSATTLLDGVRVENEHPKGTSIFSLSTRHRPKKANMFYPDSNGAFL